MGTALCKKGAWRNSKSYRIIITSSSYLGNDVPIGLAYVQARLSALPIAILLPCYGMDGEMPDVFFPAFFAMEQGPMMSSWPREPRIAEKTLERVSLSLWLKKKKKCFPGRSPSLAFEIAVWACDAWGFNSILQP